MGLQCGQEPALSYSYSVTYYISVHINPSAVSPPRHSCLVLTEAAEFYVQWSGVQEWWDSK